MAVGSGVFSATWDFVPLTRHPLPPPESFSILMQAAEGQPPTYHVVDKTPADTAALGIAAIDQGLGRVSGYRAAYGAHHSHFDHAVANLATAIENASASRSRILDADYARESAALTRSRILQDAGSAMLVQANQIPQQVLSLLRR